MSTGRAVVRRGSLYVSTPSVPILITAAFTGNGIPLGDADTGHTFTIHAGTWERQSDRATKTSATAHAQVTADLGSQAQDIECDLFGSSGALPGLVTRWSGASDHYLLQIGIAQANGAVLYRVHGGSYGALVTFTGVTPVSGDRWRLTTSAAGVHTVYRNGSALGSPVTDNLKAGTRAGMNAHTGSGACQFDNLSMTVI